MAAIPVLLAIPDCLSSGYPEVSSQTGRVVYNKKL